MYPMIADLGFLLVLAVQVCRKCMIIRYFETFARNRKRTLDPVTDSSPKVPKQLFCFLPTINNQQ